MSNDVDRSTSALRNPNSWKPSGSKLDLVLEDLSEELLVKRWKDVLSKIDRLLPSLNKSNPLKPRSRYHVIVTNLFRKLLMYIRRAINF